MDLKRVHPTHLYNYVILIVIMQFIITAYISTNRVEYSREFSVDGSKLNSNIFLYNITSNPNKSLYVKLSLQIGSKRNDFDSMPVPIKINYPSGNKAFMRKVTGLKKKFSKPVKLLEEAYQSFEEFTSELQIPDNNPEIAYLKPIATILKMSKTRDFVTVIAAISYLIFCNKDIESISAIILYVISFNPLFERAQAKMYPIFSFVMIYLIIRKALKEKNMPSKVEALSFNIYTIFCIFIIPIYSLFFHKQQNVPPKSPLLALLTIAGFQLVQTYMENIRSMFYQLFNLSIFLIIAPYFLAYILPIYILEFDSNIILNFYTPFMSLYGLFTYLSINTIADANENFVFFSDQITQEDSDCDDKITAEPADTFGFGVSLISFIPFLLYNISIISQKIFLKQDISVFLTLRNL